MKKYIKLCIALTINYFFWRGVYDNLYNDIPNNCEMTYMYEYPEYLEVDVPNNLQNSYKLYVYGEGHYARLLDKKVYKGIPVLFIPGNQGSSKQVRSLASVAYRMFQSSSSPFHFNYFAVDFNEEIGALFGPVLDRQTQFVGLAIKTILNLYRNDTKKPESVILVGHSMGGLVARAVVSLPDIPPHLVSIIITKATPHARPVVALDSALVEFSERTNAYWAQERALTLKNIVLVTIGGGKSDIQVPSSLTSSQFADIDETLLSVPSCWLTTDHLAIVWCRQLVLAINRAIFNSVDKSTMQILKDISLIKKAFTEQLSQKVESEFLSKPTRDRILSSGIKKSEIVEVNDSYFFRRLKQRFREQFFVIPLTEEIEDDILTAVFDNVGLKSHLFACNAVNTSGNLVVKSVEGLDHYTRSIPGNRKEINIELGKLIEKKNTHIVAFIQSENEQTSISMKITSEDSHYSYVRAPTLMASNSQIPVLEIFPKKSLSLNITMEGFTEFWQSYLLVFIPIGECSSLPPTVSIRSSWVDRWEYPSCRKNGTIDCSLWLDVPSSFEGEGHVEVHVVKSPRCSYSVGLEKNFRGIIERVALLFVSQIPTFVVCHLMLILANLFKAFGGTVQNSFYAHLTDLTPIAVVPFMKLLAFVFGKLSDLETDKAFLDKTRTNIEVLPIGLFVSALPLTFLFSALFRILLFGLSRLLIRFKKPKDESVKSFSTFDLFNVTSLCLVILVALGASTCGTLALVLASSIYFIKVLWLQVNLSEEMNSSSNDSIVPSEDRDSALSESVERKCVPSGEESFLHNVDNAESTSKLGSPEGDKAPFNVDGESSSTNNTSSEEEDANLEKISFEIHFTLMMLVFAVSILNLPSLIAWAKNLSFEVNLSSDPSLLTNYCILSSLFILWQTRSFKTTKKFYRIVGYMLHASCVGLLLFGSVKIFRVSEIVSYSFILISLHQLLLSI